MVKNNYEAPKSGNITKFKIKVEVRLISLSLRVWKKHLNRLGKFQYYRSFNSNVNVKLY